MRTWAPSWSRKSSTKTNDVAGDGTTTATLLAQALVREGMKNVAAGANPMGLKKRHRRRLLTRLVEAIKQAVPRRSAARDDIATRRHHFRRRRCHRQADRRGHGEGRPPTASSPSRNPRPRKPTPKWSKACSSTAATSPPIWSPIPRRWKPSWTTPIILITDKKISNIQDILPLLEQIRAGGQEAGHHRRGCRGRGAVHPDRQQAARHLHLRCGQGPRLRRPPQGDAAGYRYPHRRPGRLRGARPRAEGDHHGYAGPRPPGEGHRRKTPSSWTAWATSEQIKNRVAQIRAQIETTTSDFDREKLQERLAKLAGGVAVIKVGAATEVEMKEKKLRIEDALSATKAAVEEGIVAGGGAALVNASVPAMSKSCRQPRGRREDRRSRSSSRRWKSRCARSLPERRPGGQRRSSTRSSTASKVNYGFDFAKEEYVDMFSAGIVDPTKVARSALQNAASVAAMVLTTESLVADKKEPAPPAPAAPGGMDGMY